MAPRTCRTKTKSQRGAGRVWPAWWPGPLVHGLESIAYVVLAIFSFALFDVLGLEVVQRAALQDGFNRVMADWYGVVPSRRGWCAPTPAEVAVVLWREGDLAAPNRHWPLRYAEHAEALRAVANAGPRAVFVDVLFKDKRHEVDPHNAAGLPYENAIEPLATVIRDMAEAGVPVYLLNEGGCSDGDVLSELLPADKSTAGYVVPVTVPAKRYDEPLDEGGATPSDGIARQYPLFAHPENRTKECSAAPLRIHLDQRRRERARAVCRGFPAELQTAGLVHYEQLLTLFWGGCGESRRHTPWRFVQWIAGRDTRRGPTCLPFDVVDREGLDSPTARKRLHDKIVVYGTDFAAAGDYATTAIHRGRVPGAVVNAMALDNLQRWGTRYVREPSEPLLPGAPLTTVDAQLIAFLALLYPVARRCWPFRLLREGPPPAASSRGARREGPRTRTVLAKGVRFLVATPLLWLLVAMLPVFTLTTIALGAIAAHAFAWGFADGAIDLWNSAHR